MAVSSALSVLASESFRLLSVALAALFVYTVTLYVYRIWFSPLSHIPGPKIAAATRWYEFWYDAVKCGQYYKEVEKMHAQYGPIVRITPYEVHIDDPPFFNELYNVTKRLSKDPWYYSWLHRNGSSFATIDPEQHKLRSAVVKKALSVQSISRVEPVLKTHLQTFVQRLKECGEQKRAVPMSDFYRALATDVVTDLSLPESHYLLRTPDFGAAHSKFVRGITELSLWNRHFTSTIAILQSMPRWMVGLQGKTALDITDGLEDQKKQAQRVIANKGKPISSKDFPVIMNEVYKNPDLPPQEKTEKRLTDEIGVLIGAGGETTSHSLMTITYHVLANPGMYKRVREEIRASFSKEELEDILSYKRLENLPYLNACILEGLRLATGVCGRLPRINKSQPTTYTSPNNTKYLIPAGSPISMTILDMHYSSTYFPSPLEFRPERFLGAEKAASEKWLAPFGRGARSCVGRNLAMAEIQMAIGNLFGRCDVRLAEGVERLDVEMMHDCFAPFVDRHRMGLMLEVLS